jgi:hypothetical protein
MESSHEIWFKRKEARKKRQRILSFVSLGIGMADTNAGEITNRDEAIVIQIIRG